MAEVDRILRVSGEAIEPYIDALATLRITVFREYPYLYDGDMAYEREYLQTLRRSPRSVVVLAFDGDEVVGASTGIPMADEEDAFKQPFVDRKLDPDRVFYFGESVLRPAYRGQGVGKQFMEHRELHVTELEQPFDWLTFAVVIRDPDDPRRPVGYRPLDGFWKSRGFEPQPDMQTSYSWKEVGNDMETNQPMMFWLKKI